MPELAVGSRAELVARAIELGRAPAALAALRERLDGARATAPLFDIARFTRSLEDAYLGFAAEAAARR
jgi:predicted O-linked N-acetylglucosamine transferase (SPINDLY family)